MLSGTQVLGAESAIFCLDPATGSSWDSSLPYCPGATFFHTSAWASVLKRAYGYKPAYFVTFSGSELRSVLPLMEVSSWLTGRRGIGLPFTDHVSPLVPNADAFDSLHNAAVAHGNQRAWKYMEYRAGRVLFGEVPSSESYLGHCLDLTRGEVSLFGRLESSTRRAVRKSEQSGLKIEFARDLESVRIFHRLLCLTRRRHGVPPQPFHFFACIHRHVLTRKQGWVVLARHNGTPIAGAVYFHFGKSLVYKYGASDEKFQRLRANNLVMWEAIKRYAAEGFEALDFGRTALDNDGLRKFKLGWGATERTIDYVRQDLRTGKFSTARTAASARLTRIFQALPPPIFRLIGAALYKHVA